MCRVLDFRPRHIPPGLAPLANEWLQISSAKANGRASKIFMEHVAERSPFTLDYDQVTALEWNNASMLSGPDRGHCEPDPNSLVPVFATLAQPREQPPATEPAEPAAFGYRQAAPSVPAPPRQSDRIPGHGQWGFPTPPAQVLGSAAAAAAVYFSTSIIEQGPAAGTDQGFG